MKGHGSERSARLKVDEPGDLADEQRREHESQALLQNLYDSSPLCMGVSEVHGDDVIVVHCNVATARFVNAEPAELRGHRVTELGVSPESERQWARISQQSRRQGAPSRFDYRYGPDAWLSSVVTFLGESPSGHPRFSFVTEDITEYKRTEAALRESEERYRSLFDNMTEGFVLGELIYNGEGKPIDFLHIAANPAVESHSGVRAGALVGRTARELSPNIDPSIFDILGKVVFSGEPARYELYMRDLDRHYDCLGYRTGEHRFAALYRDVTERKRSEEALRESEERFSKAFRLNPAAMAITQLSDGRFIDVNESWERLFGWSRGEALGRTTVELGLFKDLATRETILGGLREHEPFRAYEARFDPKSGEQREVLLSTGAIDFRGVRCLLSTAQDISEHKRAEAKLRESEEEFRSERKQAEEAREAERRKDEFLAVLSHELRNPLGAIRNSLFVLKRAPSGSEPSKRAEAVIDRQITHLSRLVDDLLDVTRITRGKVQLQCDRVELATLVKRTIEDHRATFVANGIDLQGRVPVDPIWVTADATRIEQVVGNLLGNASKFTPHGGRVDLTLEKEGSSALLRVRDNGVGIDPEVIGRLFHPFTQAAQTLDRSRGGLGLGLALVKGLVELHGGSVAVASEGPGCGAEFDVRLPLCLVAAREPSVPSKPSAQRRRVLVIDDNFDAADSLKVALEFAGHDVQVAYDGPSGLARARVSHPDVVLCDIGLPGMSGYDVARAFSADDKLRGSMLIALTGYGLPEDKERAISSGFARHVTKPLSLEALEEVLDSTSANASLC